MDKCIDHSIDRVKTEYRQSKLPSGNRQAGCFRGGGLIHLPGTNAEFSVGGARTPKSKNRPVGLGRGRVTWGQA